MIINLQIYFSYKYLEDFVLLKIWTNPIIQTAFVNITTVDIEEHKNIHLKRSAAEEVGFFFT